VLATTPQAQINKVLASFCSQKEAFPFVCLGNQIVRANGLFSIFGRNFFRLHEDLILKMAFRLDCAAASWACCGVVDGRRGPTVTA
jgi:hypothetical protein